MPPFVVLRRLSSRETGSAEVNAVLAERIEGINSIRDAMQKIMGCELYTSVTYTRLQEHSRPVWILLSSARELVYHKGYTVITLRRQGEGSVKRPT